MSHADDVAVLVEALKAIGRVAFVANEGDPWYCEDAGVDTDNAYRLYREAIARFDISTGETEAA